MANWEYRDNYYYDQLKFNRLNSTGSGSRSPCPVIEVLEVAGELASRGPTVCLTLMNSDEHGGIIEGMDYDFKYMGTPLHVYLNMMHNAGISLLPNENRPKPPIMLLSTHSTKILPCKNPPEILHEKRSYPLDTLSVNMDPPYLNEVNIVGKIVRISEAEKNGTIITLGNASGKEINVHYTGKLKVCPNNLTLQLL